MCSFDAQSKRVRVCAVIRPSEKMRLSVSRSTLSPLSIDTDRVACYCAAVAHDSAQLYAQQLTRLLLLCSPP